MPQARSNSVLVANRCSLVSAGTERMVVDFAEKSVVAKARARPDLVLQTLEKARREGLLGTIEAVQNRLDQPMPLGYSSAGTIMDARGIDGHQPGDRVACAGGGHAVHAEVVSVPKNLSARIPDGVSFEHASFATLGAIALQGIRLAEPKLGEVVAVIGLGLLGQLTVQMLRANGCRVVGLDLQPQRADMARTLGAEAAFVDQDAFVGTCRRMSGGHGVDAVLITAETASNGPVEVAGEISRDKATVVAVGAVGMTIPRKVYYEKELSFLISRSYGPGRYDPAYEEKGQDYPYCYVRWTQQRNMEAFLQLLAEGGVDVGPLITHRFPIDEATCAYDVITGKKEGSFLGVVLTYPETPDLSRTIAMNGTASNDAAATSGVSLREVRLAVLGAGNFANATLLPAMKGIDALTMKGVVSGGGMTARAAADRFKFEFCATDADEVMRRQDVDLVAILTRHDLHAAQVVTALEAGKHVFVEKPLCLTEDELEDVHSAYEQAVRDRGGEAPLAMVGFNRRFAPMVVELKEALSSVREPLMLNCRINAGFIPPDHWTQDPEVGGGRLIGEGCHFIDLLIHLSGRLPVQVTTQVLPDTGRYTSDNFNVVLHFDDGSVGTVTYVANGHKGFGKEFLEVFGGGIAARLDDYGRLEIRDGSRRTVRRSLLRQDKGHRAEWEAIVAHLAHGAAPPMTFDEVVASTRTTLAAQQSLLDGGAPVIL